MRKIIVLEHISLDGVIQAPGGPDEDTSGGFAHGGWIAPYGDSVLGAALRKQMNLPFDLLAASWRRVASRERRHQVCRLKQRHLWRLASRRVFKRGCRRESGRAQTGARARLARLGKRRAAPNAFAARLG